MTLNRTELTRARHPRKEINRRDKAICLKQQIRLIHIKIQEGQINNLMSPFKKEKEKHKPKEKKYQSKIPIYIPAKYQPK